MLSDVLIRPKKNAERSDDELMKLVCSGDDGAFRSIYERYRAQIFVYCLRMINDREGAKDLVQEVFIRVHGNADRYKHGTNFSGWIHTIARNLCLNARRDRKDHVDFDEILFGGRRGKAQDSDVILRERLAAEIAALPEIYRESLVLREYEGHSYREIAEITAQPLSTVKFRIFKAREMLRESLAEFLGDQTDEY